MTLIKHTDTDRQSGITLVWQPNGDALIRDELLKTNTLISYFEIHHSPGNIIQYAIERFYSKRYYIVQDYVSRIVWRQSILGDYAESYGAFIRKLREATPGMDERPLYDYSYMFGLERERYHQMDFRESAEMLLYDLEMTYTQYQMRAQLKGIDVYTEEEYTIARHAFTNYAVIGD